MDNLLGLGSALAAMRPDDGHRYDGTLVLSALPHAPVVPGRRRPRRRLRTLLRHRGRLAALRPDAVQPGQRGIAALVRVHERP